MAVDPDGNVWVVDFGNNRLQQFDKDGGFLRIWGSKGTAAGQLTKPVDVAFDTLGRMYVSDNAGGYMDSGRVQRVERNGTVSASWRPHRPGSITNTQGLAIDKAGTVFANEGGTSVQRWFVRGAKVTISTPVSKTKAPRAKRSFEIVSQLRPVRVRANRTWDTQGTYFELWAPKAKKPRIQRATDRDRDYRQNGPT